jgi:hypothetical protein
MNHAKPSSRRSRLVRISIWTVRHHDFLARQIRIYVWTASALVLMLPIFSIIPLPIALYILLFCICAITILLWFLINWRKAILINIQDPELRQQAYRAMLHLIDAKVHHRPHHVEKTSPVRN